MPRLGDAIGQDHRRLEQDYLYLQTATTKEEKRRWKNKLCLELARHCISEDLVLLSVLEQRLSDGSDRCDNIIKDHEQVCRCCKLLCIISSYPVKIDVLLDQG